MKESLIDGDGAVVANDQPAVVAQPGEGAFNGSGAALGHLGSVVCSDSSDAGRSIRCRALRIARATGRCHSRGRQ